MASRQTLQHLIHYRQWQLSKGELLLAQGTVFEQTVRDAAHRAHMRVWDDNHSAAHIAWIRQQSIAVECVGWERWMRTIPLAQETIKILY